MEPKNVQYSVITRNAAGTMHAQQVFPGPLKLQGAELDKWVMQAAVRFASDNSEQPILAFVYEVRVENLSHGGERYIPLRAIYNEQKVRMTARPRTRSLRQQ